MKLAQLSFAGIVAGFAGLVALGAAAVIKLDQITTAQREVAELVRLQKRVNDFSAASDSMLLHGASPGLWQAYRAEARAIQSRLERFGGDNPAVRRSAQEIDAMVTALEELPRGRGGAETGTGSLSRIVMPPRSRLVLDRMAGYGTELDHTLSVLIEARHQQIASSARWTALGFAGAALLAVALGVAMFGFLHRRITGPTHALLSTIDRLRAGQTDARAPVTGGDELAELGHAFNRMLDRQQATEARLREQRSELEDREWMLRESQRIARVGTWRLDIPEQRFEWSDETYRLMGVSPRRYTPTPGGFHEFLHPDDRKRFLREAAPRPGSQQPHVLEYRIVRPDGEVRHIHERGEYQRDEQGRAVALVGTVQDITERRQLDERLREYRHLVEGSEDLCAVVDAHYRYRLVNRAYADRHQLEPAQIEGAHMRDIVGEEYFETVIRPIGERCFAGETQVYETERSYPGVGRRQLLVRYYPIAANGEQPQLVAAVLTDITEIRRARAELDRHSRLLDIAGRLGRLGGWEIDLEADRAVLSRTLTEILGLQRDRELTVEEVIELFAPEYRDRVRDLLTRPDEVEAFEDAELEILDSRGERIWVLGAVEQVRDAEGRVIRLQGALQDISARKASEQQARRLDTWLSSILDNIGEAFFAVSEDWRIRFVNRAGEDLAQRSAEELVGMDVWEAFPETVGSRVEEAYRRAMAEGVTVNLDEYDPRLDKWLEIQGNPFEDGLAIFCRDLTARKRAEHELARLAYEDPLTGIYSREGFLRKLARRLEESGWQPDGMVVMFDVEEQRAVNDSHGYSAGDELLVEVGRRLGRQAGEGSIVARIGGDEFAVFLPGDPERPPEVRRAAMAAAFRETFELGHATVSVGAWGGYTLLGDAPRDAESLLREAEVAVFQNRRSGGHETWTAYTRRRDDAMRERVALTRELRGAVEGEQLQLRFQPKIELDTGRVVGCEALLRWHHPERGMVSPAAFIPVAEQSQLIVPIGEWVLGEACRRVRQWRDASLEPVHVAVNISRAQFYSGDFPSTVQAVLDAQGVPPEALTLEVTESVFEREGESLQRQLHELHEMGLRLSLDDFGTGYSSLLYLQAYPFDEIKIDKGFVQRLMDDTYSEQVVATVLRIAEVLGVTVVSEGVETAQMRDLLLKMGSRLGQGFYYSQPLEPGAFADLLARQARLPDDNAAQG